MIRAVLQIGLPLPAQGHCGRDDRDNCLLPGWSRRRRRAGRGCAAIRDYWHLTTKKASVICRQIHESDCADNCRYSENSAVATTMCCLLCDSTLVTYQSKLKHFLSF